MAGIAQPFSTLYIEREVAELEVTQAVVERLSPIPTVLIDDHKSVFNRARQSFTAQKKRPALILASGREPYLYAASERIDAGAASEHYSDQLRNCLFRCDYCFLQGMHRSGHVLLKVNEADFHAAAQQAAQNGPIWLNVSFLSDLLAFERYVPLVSGWVSCADRTANLTVEIRTKCGGTTLLESMPISDRSVFTWTISPERFARRYEGGTASTSERLDAAAAAASSGRRVRLAFDPVVLIDGWKQAYKEVINDTFEVIAPDSVEMVTFGVFRMSTDYLDKIRKLRADSPILYHPFERDEKVASYSADEIEAVRAVMMRHLGRFLPDERITFVHG